MGRYAYTGWGIISRNMDFDITEAQIRLNRKWNLLRISTYCLPLSSIYREKKSIMRNEEKKHRCTLKRRGHLTSWEIPLSTRTSMLTHLYLVSHKRDIGKQCRSRSDAAERGVWLESTLFALNTRVSLKPDTNKKKLTRHPFYWNWTCPKTWGRRVQ